MLKYFPEILTGEPCDKCPPQSRLIPITVAPGLTSAKNTAKLACAPECGCTFAYSQPKSFFALSIASVSTTSTYSQPP